MPIAVVESLDHEARGVAHVEGKTIFIDGALPGETVEYASFRKKSSYELAHLLAVIKPASSRVRPRCPHFGICGGCAMQHVEPATQVAVKQRVLEDNLWHIGRVRAHTILPPIAGPAWGYRHRARLSVRHVLKKGGMLVGFHERRSSYVADMRECAVLPPSVSALLLPLRELFAGLSICDRLPQVEVAVGSQCTALVLRILEPLTAADEVLLKRFADEHRVVFYLQEKGPDSVYRFYPSDAPALAYDLPEFAVHMEFRPTDFTQVNHAINQVLLRRALNLLQPQAGECIADLFCGLGNFSLPIARSGAEVVGVEGSPSLVKRATDNAALHGLSANTTFYAANLFQCESDTLAAWLPANRDHWDKLLIDPPREGAIEVVKALPEDDSAPRRIVYVSCNPATLARDAGLLCACKGYRLDAAGIVNMFPHTAHVESIAVFNKK